VLLTAFGFGVIGLVANHMRERADKQKEYQAALRERIIELEASRRRIVIAQETVRRQIAGRLHGPVQTNLLILQRRLGECQGKIPSQPDEAVSRLAKIVQELDKLRNEDLRSISRELHPSIIRMGLPAGLRSLRDHFSPMLTIEMEIDEEIARLDEPANYLTAEDTGLALYRFAEEALNNIAKHARASRAVLRLWRPDHEHVELSVADDGVGFVVGTVTPGLGMLAMQDYIGAVAGDYYIESSPGKGTVVKARVPVRAPGL
jgi:signal transduction histidine kinase